MKAIEFRGVNIRIAEDQPGYNTLPAMALPDGQVITCWEFEDEDLENIAANGGKIYISLFTFNKPFQPISVMTDLADGFDLKQD